MAGNRIQKGLVLTAFVYCVAFVLVALNRTGGDFLGSAMGEAPREGSWLVIPTLGVMARMQSVGLTAVGDIGIPTNFTDVAWFNNSVKPGAVGTSVVVGHKDTGKSDTGVFRNLSRLGQGDDIYTYEEGVMARFRVVRLETYPAGTERMAEVLDGVGGMARLNLITCSGAWNNTTRRYEERLVVFTERVE